MRKNCSYSEFNSQRREHLLRGYRESIARQSKISAERAFRDAADAPSPRFWVSEDRAAEVVSKIISNPSVITNMYKEKAEMYLEIYRRVLKLRKVYPDAPLSSLIFRVVNSTAPKSYLTWQRARTIIRNRK